MSVWILDGGSGSERAVAMRTCIAVVPVKGFVPVTIW
jgi:hypothetical protein